MNVVYLSASRIPDRRAAAIQQVRMCEAFARAGASVKLVHPRHAGDSSPGGEGDWSAFYGVVSPFELVTLPSLLGIRSRHGWLPPGVGMATMLASFAAYFLREWAHGGLGSDVLVYSRNVYAIRELLLLEDLLRVRKRPKVAIELHSLDAARPGWLEAVIRRVDLIVTITDRLRRDVAALHGVDLGAIRVEPDGVDLRLFEPAAVPQGAAGPYTTPRSGYRAVVGYAGHLYEGRGVETIVECARLLPDVLFMIVGGFPQDIAALRGRLTERDRNVDVVGFVPPALVGGYLAAADILVAPYTRKVSTIHHASPLKVFEYMASRKPIVITDHAVFREVLDDGESAVFIPEEDPSALRDAIQGLLDDPIRARRLAGEAFQKVQRYTWENRAKRIFGYLNGPA